MPKQEILKQYQQDQKFKFLQDYKPNDFELLYFILKQKHLISYTNSNNPKVAK